MQIKSQKDFVAGLLFSAIGVAFAAGAVTYEVGTGDRSEKIRTYNFPQDRLTDHRLDENFSNLPVIMSGELGPLHEALKTHFDNLAISGE